VTLVLSAVFTKFNFGDRLGVTVLESWFEVTFVPLGVVPLLTAVFTNGTPASRSACVTVYEAVKLAESPGAKSTLDPHTPAVPPAGVTLEQVGVLIVPVPPAGPGSVTLTPSTLTLPVLVTVNV
jgi:hypothetical protein